MRRGNGGGIGKPSTPTGASTPGVWSLAEQNILKQKNEWPSTPSVPTNVSAEAGDALAIVSFDAPTDTGGQAITSYTVTASPGNITATGAGSPITVTGLTNYTAYTFTVRANNAVGGSVESSSTTSVTPTDSGQQQFISPGTFTWVAPLSVNSICVVCVGGGGAGDDGNTGDGGGGGGGGGALAFANNVPVTPGASYTVVVGAAGTSGNGRDTQAQSGNLSRMTIGSFVITANGGTGGPPYPAAGGGGGTFTFSNTPAGVTTGGGNGGSGGHAYNGGGGGGGAGGYGGKGGDGSRSSSYGSYASGLNGAATGAGGGGGAELSAGTGGTGGGNGGAGQTDRTGGGGGGANIYSSTHPATNGANGNGSAANPSVGGAGGRFGGGGGGAYDGAAGLPAAGGSGAVRIIWGAGRSFPSNAADV